MVLPIPSSPSPRLQLHLLLLRHAPAPFPSPSSSQLVPSYTSIWLRRHAGARARSWCDGGQGESLVPPHTRGSVSLRKARDPGPSIRAPGQGARLRRYRRYLTTRQPPTPPSLAVAHHPDPPRHFLHLPPAFSSDPRRCRLRYADVAIRRDRGAVRRSSMRRVVPRLFTPTVRGARRTPGASSYTLTRIALQCELQRTLRAAVPAVVSHRHHAPCVHRAVRGQPTGGHGQQRGWVLR